jgi:GH24 family phage-related lysozyme (muramidase)
MANKTSCKAGRTRLIDPNSFDGQSSSSNVPVQLEDLNISVQLETFKKSRSVLIADNSNSRTENTKNVRVTFIEGKESPDGKKYLTTSFTDLTTVFNNENNAEDLGISSIDIDFNSSYAPLVTINFIDVRGSAIFQNEENLIKGENKYASFFELPYPLYELTIKGYYGKPVKYCLHMTKFNSRFNSKTGNFEITASFVGYTYAMLSDMLIGFLKAISETTEGIKAYTEINENREDKVLTINELISKLSFLNEQIEKTSALSENSKRITEIENKLLILTQIEDAIRQLGSSIEDINLKTKFPIILRSDISQEIQITNFQFPTQQTNEINNPLIQQPFVTVSDATNVNLQNQITQIENSRANAPNDEDLITVSIGIYINKIKELIIQYTENKNQPPLDFNVFVPNSPQHSFNNLTKQEFDPNFRTTESDVILKSKLSQAPNSYLNEGSDVFTYKVNQYYEILSRDYADLDIVKPFTVYDMTYAYESIDAIRETLLLDKVDLLESLASEIDIKIKEELGVSPTVRNIVEVFTTAVEVFMKSIYRVSVQAEKSVERKNELSKILGNFQSDLVNTDNIYPWPEYVENTELGLIEKYLGSVKNINISNVPELEFIEDLFEAFIKSEKNLQELNNELVTKYQNWIPANPLDTSIFVAESPYERLGKDKTNINLVIATILTRAMLFLNYTNRVLTDEEIQQMATYEANLISALPDALVKSAIANKTLKQLLDSSAQINGNSVKVLKEEGVNYSYNLLFNNNSNKLIPIKYKKLDEWDITKTYTTTETNNSFSSGSVYFQKEDTFLTNDVSSENDGGLYVQILSDTQYEGGIQNLSEEVNTESVILLDKIKGVSADEVTALTNDLKSAGFNPFGGPYGVQEFSNMDYGDDNLNGLPLKYVFYGDSILQYNNRTVNLNNGLSINSLEFVDTFNESKFLFPHDAEENYSITPYDSDTNFYNASQQENATISNYGKNRLLFNYLLNGTNKNVTYKYINQELWVKNATDSFISNKSFSLFGSLWYYGQTNEFTKALLFLNTLPFNCNIIKGNSSQSPTTNNFINVTLESAEILRLFDQRGGFIKAPRLLVAYVGGILWREESINDVVVFEKTIGNLTFPIIPGINKSDFFPDKDEYLRILTRGISGIDSTSIPGKVKISPILLGLPKQVKEEFKRVFFDFVTGVDSAVYTSWPTIKNKVEIWDGTYIELINKFELLYENIDNLTVGDFSEFKNLENYNIVTLNKKNKEEQNRLFKYTMMLELYGNYSSFSRSNTSEPSVPRILIDAMMEEVVIANNNYKIWKKDYSVEPIQISAEKLEFYLNTITTALSSFQDPTSQEKQIQQEVFGTDNQDVIKLQLYRTCKNIYDKWVGGVENENKLLYQCGQSDTPNRRTKDSLLAKQKGYLENSLISSFRFVSRSFQDIGDKFYINPLPIVDLVRRNPNASFYDIISGLLADNNFDFIALPTYIDYSSDEELGNLFRTYPNYENAISDGICGPSFVCVYVGQKSKNLDFLNNKESYYSNDGFDIKCNEQSIISSLPIDFTTDVNNYEDPVSVFAVNFSQQNQNIFKDITLDQSEFTETAESLKITDDIANKGTQNNVTLAGQNIYNVYSVRSYKAEVEMMGNAMIQPMMYFQLNNIPMFHGAYLITHVKHSLKPNNMTTNFTGVRTKKAETPLIPAEDFYMSLIQGLGVVNTDDVRDVISRRTPSRRALPPIVRTLLENGFVNGGSNAGNVVLSPVRVPNGIENRVSGNFNVLIEEAITPFFEMLKDWVNWMIEQGFVGQNGNYAYINSLFRTYEIQKQLKEEAIAKNRPKTAAEPGTSNHGWGIAVDIQTLKKDGTQIGFYGTTNRATGFDLNQNESLVWLLDNSYRYGWIIPQGVINLGEFWHFEYHGKSAKCILDKNKIKFGRTIDTSKPYESFVTNPKDKDGNEVNYSDCEYITVKLADGSGDFISSSYPNVKPTDSQLKMINNLSGTWDERAKTFIKKFEGFTTNSKWDANAWRGGYGSDQIVTSQGGNPTPVTQSTVWTEQTADYTLQYDVNNRFKNSVINVLGQQNWDKLNDNRKAAIISYAYNTGAGTLRTRGIVDAITNNNWDEASKSIFDGPITSSGKVLDGLIRRRKCESILFDKLV